MDCPPGKTGSATSNKRLDAQNGQRRMDSSSLFRNGWTAFLDQSRRCSRSRKYRSRIETTCRGSTRPGPATAKNRLRHQLHEFTPRKRTHPKAHFPFVPICEIRVWLWHFSETVRNGGGRKLGNRNSIWKSAFAKTPT